MTIIWTTFALEKLSEIANALADDRTAAEKWMHNMFDAVMVLMDAPEEGRVVPGVDGSEVREAVIEHQRIIYTVEDDHLKILTIREPK